MPEEVQKVLTFEIERDWDKSVVTCRDGWNVRRRVPHLRRSLIATKMGIERSSTAPPEHQANRQVD